METAARWIVGATMVLCAILTVACIYLLFMVLFSPKLELLKDEWKCTASHNEIAMMLVGKVLVPTAVAVCDRYERK